MAKKPKRVQTMAWSDAENAVRRRLAGEYADGSGSTSMSGDRTFTGTDSLADCSKLLAGGWVDGTRTVARGVARVLEEATTRPEWTHDVSGWLLDPVAWIANDPECFWTRENVEEFRPRLRIVYPLAYNCDVSAAGVTRYAVALAALVRKLEDDGVEVEVVGVDATDTYDGTYVLGVEVRKFGQPLDLSKIAFASHPSFLRRVLFAVRELESDTPTSLRSGGYGSHATLRPEYVREAYASGADAAVLMPEVATLAPQLTTDGKILEHALPLMLKAIEDGIKRITR